MARDFGPFPSKPMYEVVNRRMQRVLAEASFSTGFAKGGQGTVTAGTGAQLVIAAYTDGALVDGLYVENFASETVAITTNSSSNPRIDRLVMRLDMGAQTIAPFIIQGTPGASPQIPPLVQTSTVFDMPLCRYTMPGSGSAQNPGSIVDERYFLDRRMTMAQRRALPTTLPVPYHVHETDTGRDLFWNGSFWRLARTELFDNGSLNTGNTLSATGWASTDWLWTTEIGQKITVPGDLVYRDMIITARVNISAGPAAVRIRMEGSDGASYYWPSANGIGVGPAAAGETAAYIQGRAQNGSDGPLVIYLEVKKTGTTSPNVVVPTLLVEAH